MGTSDDDDAPRDRELESKLETLFDEHCNSLVFVLDEIFVDGTAIQIQIGLDVPDEVGDAIQANDFVRKPVKAFLTKARKELPDRQISVSLFVESLAESPADAWRRLEIALVQQGKSKPLFDELVKLKRK